MYLVLFGVGLLITAAGFVTIGFGIPINAFSLGNTLIIAGTVAVVGGLVLIGLGAAIRQLSRIAEALHSRPVGRPAPSAEISESVPPTARMPPTAVRTTAPVKPPEAPRPPEPRSHAAASDASGPLDWLRNKPKSAGEAPPIAPEPPVVEVPDEAPLSPRAPQRPHSAMPPGEPPAEPKPWVPRRHEAAPEPKEPHVEPAPVPRSEQVARMMPPSERASEATKDFAKDFAKDFGKDAGKPAGKDAGLFDVVWPDARSKPIPGGEPVRREPKPEPMPRQRAEAAAERPSAILKSGVIDGMAYTLYADGSIEAELPQGTVRFASVDALRAHLEKST